VTTENLAVNSPLSHRKKKRNWSELRPLLCRCRWEKSPQAGFDRKQPDHSRGKQPVKNCVNCSFWGEQPFLRNANMHDPNDFEVIFRMTITRGGRKIRRSDGKPWKIVLRK
jgi:hypothetical protein